MRLKPSLLIRTGLCALAVAAGLAMPRVFAEPPATQPAASIAEVPTTNPAPATQPSISADAQKELDAITAGYNKLASLDLTGTLDFEADVNGEVHKESSSFTSTFQAPVKFRHSMKDDLLVGCTGDKTFLYAPERKVYLQIDAPKTKADFTQLPSPASNAVLQQNPSLFLALSENAGQSLTTDAIRISKAPDEKIGDKAFVALAIETEDADRAVLLDPDTHLVRQIRIDLSKQLKTRGVPNVKTAVATFNYSPVVPNADVKADQFAWAPPEGAKDAGAGDSPVNEAAMALIGKPAPDFSLPGLDDKTVNLKDLKGSVVVVDFWATWCAPCVMEMPHWDRYYQEKKSAGLKMFAINQQQEKAPVQAFVNKAKLTLPMLLDLDGKADEAYGVQGLPQTVLIGKDGLVKKIIMTIRESDTKAFKAAVEKELAAK